MTKKIRQIIITHVNPNLLYRGWSFPGRLLLGLDKRDAVTRSKLFGIMCLRFFNLLLSTFITHSLLI